MFEKVVVESEFFSPLQSFDREVQSIEYRRDPLLSTWCRINVKRTERVKQWKSDADFWELVYKSRKGCFFCPDNIEKATPKFLPEIVPEGRLKLGETLLFPNLFPFAQHHAVATITEEHFADLNEFTSKQIENTLLASIDYFKRVHKADEKARWPSFNWNHLPPSGASILHPHVQLLVDERATYMNDTCLKASSRYYKDKGRNYWLDLIKEEKKVKERFIGYRDDIAWMATFAPLGNNEVTAVFEKYSSLDLPKKQVRGFAGALEKIFKGYYKLGVKSFNLTTYSAAIGEQREDFLLNVKIISRPPPLRDYTSDAGFLEALHMERVVESMPEKLAEELRLSF
ncbi:MAG: hypothetical protein V3T58_02810 [Candidatus Hydrothermarchaeales archaeon]